MDEAKTSSTLAVSAVMTQVGGSADALVVVNTGTINSGVNAAVQDCSGNQPQAFNSLRTLSGHTANAVRSGFRKGAGPLRLGVSREGRSSPLRRIGDNAVMS